MTGEPPHPASRCSVADVLRTSHDPHLWAWHNQAEKGWRVVAADDPVDDAYWCDGGMLGGTR